MKLNDLYCKICIICFLMIASSTAVLARVTLDIGLIFEKGIGKDFALKSEVYMRKKQYYNEIIYCRSPNGIAVSVQAEFIEHSDKDRSLSQIKFKAILSHKNKEKKIINDVVVLNKMKEFSFIYENDQRIIFQITPRFFSKL